MKKTLLLMLSCIVTVAYSQTYSPYIVIDQFGYRPTGQKIAVLRDPQTGADAAESYTPGLTYAVVNEVSKVQVSTGSAVAWNAGGTDPHSGDKVWHFDFSSVTTPGTYYVLDVTNNVKSYSFDIKEDVYNEVLKHAVRTFFYQRANFAKTAPYAALGYTDGASHVGPNQQKNCRYYLDESNASLERNLTGGWFDAGDYYKYTPWTAGYVIMMLKAYGDNPTAWTDDYNLPASGNQIPDLLDEAKWGMDYLRRLQNSDGSLISLVSGGGGSPPSSSTAKCLYGPVSTAATIRAAAAFAMGAKIYKMIGRTCYADTLQIASEKAWIWAKNNPSVFWNNDTDAKWTTAVSWAGGPMNYADYDIKMMTLEAAAYLFGITETTEYKTYFDANYTTGHLIAWNHMYPFEHDYQEALLHYTSLSGATPAVVSAIKNSCNIGMNKSAALNGLGFGPYDSKTDAYYSYMKDYVWGSNANKCGTGLQFYEVVKYGINPTRNTDAMIAAENYIHYIHGLNPLSKNYLSNMNPYGADNSVSEFFHGWFTDGSALWDKVGVSTYGPAPGFLVGGPNPGYKKDGCCPSSCFSPEKNALCTSFDISKVTAQPNTKSYMDFNTDWPINSWAISENSNGYQVNYIRLLANFVKNVGVVNSLSDCEVTAIGATKTSPVEVYPNPSEKSFHIVCNTNFKAEVYGIEGKLMDTIEANGRTEVGNHLEAGVYVIKVMQQNNAHYFKVLKY